MRVHRMPVRVDQPARCPVVRELRAWPVEHVEAARTQLLPRNAMQWHLEPLPSTTDRAAPDGDDMLSP
ncbi:hypothetical protein ACIBQ2_27770 [Micromonospora sediminimaris]|uniref:hypothetical protein n=1 Tax=Micromonospora sediminimaris TaxID=547162 RepID=UPI0037AB35C7